MSSMEDLVAWLRQHLDDDERVARAASRTQTNRPHKGRGVAWRAYLEGGGDGWAIESADGEHSFVVGHPEALARHVERWDPARVLAEIQAKRRILDLCVALRPDPGFAGEWELYPGDTAEMATRTIMELAQPYAGRDGWQDEWADTPQS